MNTNILNGLMTPQPTIPAAITARNTFATLTAEGSTITITDNDGTSTTINLHTPVLCALACGSEFVVMTAAGPRVAYNFDGVWMLSCADSKAPGATFTVTSEGTLSATTPSFTSPSGTSLAEGAHAASALRRKVTSALIEAYDEVRASADAARLFIQPVIARCRYVDREGATLHYGAPQLLGVDSLWQCGKLPTVAVSKRSDTDFTITPMTVAAEAWSLTVTVPGIYEEGMERVAKVIVELTGAIDPVDRRAVAAMRFERVRDTSPACTAALPGTTAGMTALTHSLRQRAADLVASFDSVCGVSVVLTPGALSTVWRVFPVDAQGTAGHLPVDDSFEASVRPPHSFVAGHVVRSGDCVAWADITPKPFTGYHAAELLAQGTSSFDCKVEILSATSVIASRVDRVEERSREFAPLVSYPHPAAGAVRITFLDTGEVITAPLAPVGPVAVSFPQFPAEQPSHTPGDASCFGHHFGGAALSADASDALRALSAVNVCEGLISGITPACRSHSSWDFAKSHLYAFSSSGIYALCFNAARKYVSATLIDTRPAVSGGLFTSEAVYAPVPGGLVVITGARARRYVPLPFDVTSLSWHSPMQWLLCEAADGRRLWLDPPDNLCLAGPPGQVLWSVDAVLPAGKSACFAEVAMIASAFKGRISVTADGGDLSAAPVCLGSVDIDGDVEAPVRWRILTSPRRARVTITLSGTARSLRIISHSLTRL